MRNEKKGNDLLPGFEALGSSRLIVRHCANAHPHICDYFVKKHGFFDLCRLKLDLGAKSKLAHFRDIAVDFVYVLRNLGRIRQAREIIVIGVVACNIALLLKLGLLPRCRRTFWFGLFIHHPRWLKFVRSMLRFLDSSRIRYVVFSQFERSLYAKSLSLNEGRILYVPYGNLSEAKNLVEKKPAVANESGSGEFYFSGGYSNRDYLSLIEIFRNLPHKLVIVCSALNREIHESDMPPNIKVLRDLSSDSFDAFLRASKACIIPIAHDLGAAGQSCLLRYMENRKIIIATDTGIIREYITNGVSGILVKDNNQSMAASISAVEANFESCQGLGDAAYERYVTHFSREAIAKKLDLFMDEKVESSSDDGFIPAFEAN